MKRMRPKRLDAKPELNSTFCVAEAVIENLAQNQKEGLLYWMIEDDHIPFFFYLQSNLLPGSSSQEAAEVKRF